MKLFRVLPATVLYYSTSMSASLAAPPSPTTSLAHLDNFSAKSAQNPILFYKPMKPNPPIPDYPDLDKPITERIEFLNMGHSNMVMCWPSVGGIIIAETVQSVELDFIGVDRFTPVERSYNTTEEDAFCRKLRLVGGKWWDSYSNYIELDMKIRNPTIGETEVLYLGWPARVGVWVIRMPSRNQFWYGFDRHRNAHTMEERCKALEMAGATFFENPRDCEHVEPLLRGFGEWKPESRYLGQGDDD